MIQKGNIQEAGFKCQKCGYYSPLGEGLIVKQNFVLCDICNKFFPNNKEENEEYVKEKIDWQVLETFRRHYKGNNMKEGMIETAKKGNIVSRPAFGYKMEDGKLVPADNKEEVREIYEEFVNGSSLNEISRIHNLSVNGIKKILKNFTYIGKVKFDNQILKGNHESIISPELFNRAQRRFEKS